MLVRVTPTLPMKDAKAYTIWHDDWLIGWADAVVLGQPSRSADDIVATSETIHPIRWGIFPTGRVRAQGWARLFYGYAPHRGAKLPDPILLPQVKYETTRDDMIRHGWTEVHRRVNPSMLPTHSGFLTDDIGCWAINEVRLA
jgi:hypothetical protein